MTGSISRRRIAAVAGVLAWMLLVTPAAAQTSGDQPPDQVDPPAPGEGEPLDDPTDPPPPAYTTAAAQPSASITLTSGPTWPRPSIQQYRARDRYVGARLASRTGWSDRAPYVVVSSGRNYAASIAASSLAGAVNGPLLFTMPRRLPDSAAREISRLRPRRVFIVGPVGTRVAGRVRNLGFPVTKISEANRFATAMSVARAAIRHGANNGTVIVASGARWADALGVAALASGKQLPVLLAKRSTGAAVLARRVRDLGARRVLVAARPSVINASVIRDLPNVQRIAGSTAMAVAATTARRARALGLNNRPFLVSASHWTDAMAWGAMAGNRRGSAVLASRGPGLVRPVADWLQDFRPGRVATVKATRQLAAIARCQVATGRFRSWFCAERALRRQGYDIRQADGRVDRFSIWAIYAFEKVAGRAANGSFGNAEWSRMLRNPRHAVRRPDLPSTHVEIDIGRQLILLVKNGKVRNQIHTSTGKPSTPTIRGTFTVYEKRPYYQTHNRMYWPIFFYGGYALHGYPEIPTYPASAGCARTYNGNMDFIYPKIFIGERVATY